MCVCMCLCVCVCVCVSCSQHDYYSGAVQTSLCVFTTKVPQMQVMGEREGGEGKERGEWEGGKG